MTVKIMGVESQNFTFDDGKSYQGKKLHVAVVDEHKDNLIGCPVTVIKIPSTSEFYNMPIEVDKLYNVFFNQNGKLAYFVANGK